FASCGVQVIVIRLYHCDHSILHCRSFNVRSILRLSRVTAQESHFSALTSTVVSPERSSSASVAVAVIRYEPGGSDSRTNLTKSGDGGVFISAPVSVGDSSALHSSFPAVFRIPSALTARR